MNKIDNYGINIANIKNKKEKEIMHQISLKKRRFLESIGIDINNLPTELKKYSPPIESVFSKEEIDFLQRESLTGRYKKSFCLKDLVGTVHPDYTDKTWIEAFILSKRGDNIVEEYLRNPDYYWVELKKQDQTNLRHDTPIELLESNGKFFINGGNNRLSLIMMRYLAEISKAQTEDEKTKIDEKYTFVAEVQSTPKDKDIMYMMNMIREAYGSKAIIKRIAANEEECKYIIKIENETIIINNKEELAKALRDSYKVEKVEDIEDLQYNILNLLQDKIIYEARTDQNRAKILNSIFANLEKFQESFVKLRRFKIEDKLYEGIDLRNLSFSELSNKAIQMAQTEETRIKQEQEIEERRKKELEEEKQRIREQNRKDVTFALKIEHVHQQINNIITSVENIYYELKGEEMKFSKLANKFILNYSITTTNDTNIHLSIEQLKGNIQKLIEQIQKIDNIEELQKISKALQELENLTRDETIKNNYSIELKEEFARSFDDKVQELILNSRIAKLKEQREEVEKEKVTFIGRIAGKVKLKQAKLDNINLKMQLLMLDNKKNKISYSLEETLSDLYTYSQGKSNNDLTLEMSEFLDIVKEDSELKEMIEQEQLNSKVDEKVNSIQSEIQLIPTNDSGRVSNRYQANILELQNNDINRQIQNNRARAIIKQNDLLNAPINSKASLNKFQNIINQINLKVQLKDTRIVEKEEQEK